MAIESSSSLASISSPAPDPVQILENATRAMDAGDDDQAFELARRLARLTPEDPQSVFLMARLLGKRHRFPEAIQMLNQLAVTTPDARLPILGQTAQWMVQFGQWSEAEKRYRAILDEIPAAILVHRNLAQLYVRQGRRIEAAEHLRLLCRLGDIEEIELRHLLRINRAFPADAAIEELDPVGQRGIAITMISQDDWAAAKSYLEGRDPIEPAAFSLLGRVYVNLNDFDALRRWSEESSQIDQENVDAWFARGALAANQDDHSGAIRSLSEVLLRDPTDGDAYLLFSQSLAHVDAAKESETAADRAKLIVRTQTFGAEMAQSADRDDAKLSLLIDSLDQLDRPWEALRWCGVRLGFGRSSGSLSEAEMEALSESIRDRTAKLSRVDTPPTREFLLCGFDLNTLPPSNPSP